MSTQPDAPARPGPAIDVAEAPTAEELRRAYRVGVRSRSVEEHIVRLVSRGEVKFAIWGPGEEVHGTATALALSKVVAPDRFAFVGHYRSGALCSMWCELNGVDDFTDRMIRQQFSRATDGMSGGRQMVYHLNLPEVGILPIQSPVGMQLGKAAGYALGYRLKGITDAVTMGIVGDGTTAEGDMHDAMNAISVWKLPTIVMVTDNRVAISTLPEEGRGIVDFEAYARGFGLEHFSCDGRDFHDVYRTVARAGAYCREAQRGCVLYVHSLPRFNGHSSAADVTFDLSQADPLIAFGQQLVDQGILKPDDVLTRIEGTGRDFFAHHRLGTVMGEADAGVKATLDAVRDEPHPDPATLTDHTYAPFPDAPETEPGPGSTNVSYAGAIRSALDKLIVRHQGFVMGQDVGRLGGVMTATAGLQGRHPDRVVDAPLNEPLIVGASTGLALHDDLMALPEIQFGDYSLNAFHWLVYLGTIRWTNLGGGQRQAAAAHADGSLRGRRGVPLDVARRLLHADPRPGGDHAVHQLRHPRPAVDRRRLRRSGGLPRAQVDVSPDPGPRVPRGADGQGRDRRHEEGDHARRGPRSARCAGAVQQGGDPSARSRCHRGGLGPRGVDLPRGGGDPR